jgi:hypothetical protein
VTRRLPKQALVNDPIAHLSVGVQWSFTGATGQSGWQAAQRHHGLDGIESAKQHGKVGDLRIRVRIRRAPDNCSLLAQEMLSLRLSGPSARCRNSQFARFPLVSGDGPQLIPFSPWGPADHQTALYRRPEPCKALG